MKTTDVYGVSMTSLQEIIFMKWLNTKGISMNTKTKEERLILATDWLFDNKCDLAMEEYDKNFTPFDMTRVYQGAGIQH